MASPTTSVLDYLDRPNENPLTGPLGNGPIRPADSRLQLVGKALQSVGASGSAYTTATYVDAEIWGYLKTKPPSGSDHNLLCRIQSPNSANIDAYNLAWRNNAGTDTWEIYRVDNNAFTLLGATVTGPELNVNDGYLFQVVADQLIGSVYQNGVWTEVIRRVDKVYASAGNIGIRMDSTTGEMRTIGGGLYAPPLVRIPVPLTRAFV